MNKWILSLILLFAVVACHGQSKRATVDYVTTPEDRALAEQVLADLRAHPGEEPGAQMVRAAKDLLGQPYVAGTLEELPDLPHADGLHPVRRDVPGAGPRGAAGGGFRGARLGTPAKPLPRRRLLPV